MSKIRVTVLHWLPDGMLGRLRATFPRCDFLEGEDSLSTAEIVYGFPPLSRLEAMDQVRWIQLGSAGVPPDLCPIAQRKNIQVTNLAGLYGPDIGEHALGLMITLTRALHLARDQQQRGVWERSIMRGMSYLQGKTLALVGLGNIGQGVARLARSHGMRVIGCRRRPQITPFVDRVYPLEQLKAMLGEADVVCVAAPLTRHTEGMLGPPEFEALKPGALYVNVSRGPVAQDAALVVALKSGQVAAAGMDVTAVEPLPVEHPLWTMPQVIITPHVSGETINYSTRPAQRLTRNLEAWHAGQSLEGLVDLEWGY